MRINHTEVIAIRSDIRHSIFEIRYTTHEASLIEYSGHRVRDMKDGKQQFQCSNAFHASTCCDVRRYADIFLVGA